MLLRLLPAALEDGRLAGQVELVDTGERTIVRSTEELLAYLREHAPPPPSSQLAPGAAGTVKPNHKELS